MQVPDQSESERMIVHGTQHQVTTLLSKIKSVLVIEDLNVSRMLQNYHLARAIGDVGFYEFKRQLLYNASWHGNGEQHTFRLPRFRWKHGTAVIYNGAQVGSLAIMQLPSPTEGESDDE